MADGITTQSSTLATIPTATKIATDDAGSPGHVQLVKLAVSTDGSATALTADNTDGLLVKVTNAFSTVTSQSQASSGLTTATTAYTAGDVLGAGWTFTSMGSGGFLPGFSLTDKTGVLTAQVALHFFSGAVTFGTDNAAPSLSSADAQKHLFTFGSQTGPGDLGTGLVISNFAMNAHYKCDSTSLYVYATAEGGATGFFAAAGDLVLRLIYQPWS